MSYTETLSIINSCKYTWFLATGLKNYNKRQNWFGIDKQKCDLNIKYAA